MQPKTLALVVTVLPILVINLVYVISSSANLVPSCIPYLEGCTSISRAARQGNSLFIFRAGMIVQAVLLIWYWIIAREWLAQLSGKRLISIRIMCWLGVIASLFLILYADFLGTDGRMYRYLRHYGIVFFFTLTPFAQMLMLNQLFKLHKKLNFSRNFIYVLRYQLVILVSILLVGFISLAASYTGNNNFELSNIMEWNYAVLMAVFHFGSYLVWGELKISIMLNKTYPGS